MAISTTNTNYRMMDVLLCHDCSSGRWESEQCGDCQGDACKPPIGAMAGVLNTRRPTIDVNGDGDQDCVDDGGEREQQLTFISTQSNIQYKPRCIPLALSPAL